MYCIYAYIFCITVGLVNYILSFVIPLKHVCKSEAQPLTTVQHLNCSTVFVQIAPSNFSKTVLYVAQS